MCPSSARVSRRPSARSALSSTMRILLIIGSYTGVDPGYFNHHVVFLAVVLQNYGWFLLFCSIANNPHPGLCGAAAPLDVDDISRLVVAIAEAKPLPIVGEERLDEQAVDLESQA